MYIRLNSQNIVREVIPDIDPALPGIPIEERYPANFVADLKWVPDDSGAEQNLVYIESSGTFSNEIPPLTIIKIAPNDNGSHNNQTINGVTSESFHIPEDWAIVPGDMLPLENFPFGNVTVENGVVTGWTPLPIPEPEPAPEPEPTMEDIVKTMLGG